MACVSFSLCAAVLLAAIADAAQTGRQIFLSTQLRPIEEAQKMRNLILKGFPGEVDYITEQPQQLPVRIKAERQGPQSVDVVGALHGELLPLVTLDALVPLDDLANKLTDRGIRDQLLTFGKFGYCTPALYPVDGGELHHGRQQKGRCLICRMAPTSTRSVTISSPPGPTRSSRIPVSACSRFRRGTAGSPLQPFLCRRQRPYSCQLFDAEQRKCAFGQCDARTVDRLRKECLRDGGRP
jgi:hypothetical protein